jgi:hypothetical protein
MNLIKYFFFNCIIRNICPAIESYHVRHIIIDIENEFRSSKIKISV